MTFVPSARDFPPHLPHLEFYRVVGWGQVEIVGEPQIPTDGEQVMGAACVSVAVAGQRFCEMGRFDLADLYRLAAAISGQ